MVFAHLEELEGNERSPRGRRSIDNAALERGVHLVGRHGYRRPLKAFNRVGMRLAGDPDLQRREIVERARFLDKMDVVQRKSSKHDRLYVFVLRSEIAAGIKPPERDRIILS